MNAILQNFINIAVENQLLEADYCTALAEQLGGDPDVMEFAQTILNQVAESDPDNAEAWQSNIQQMLEMAAQQGASPQEEAPQGENSPGEAASAGEGVNPDVASGAVPEGPLSEEEGIAFLQQISATLRQVSSMSDEQVAEFMKYLLLSLRSVGASDLHISSEAPLFLRKNLHNYRPDPEWSIPDADSKRLNLILLNERQKKSLDENFDLTFPLEFNGNRFRAALMYHKNGISGSYRIVPGELKSLQELGYLPEDASTLEKLLDYSNGLILVTGPIGNGKTTTLASMIEVANQRRQDHVISVEDPVEIVIPSKQCQITQRQIGTATKSYHSALKGALREDPDIIVIGELNDLETIENAITASETGHLVIGTLPTCDAANTLNRLLDVFPPSQQPQIRAMVSGSLRGIVCQKLVPAVAGGLTICYEILVNTLSIANNIQDGSISNLRGSMEIGSKDGMFTMDQKALELYEKGIISLETARAQMTNRAIIEQINRSHAIKEAKKLKQIMDEKKAAEKARKG